MFQREQKGENRYYNFYWSGDPAFDSERDSFNHESWCDTGDMTHLPVLEGRVPMRFVLRRLSAMEQCALQDFARANDDGISQYIAMLIRGALWEIKDAFGPGDDYLPGREVIRGVNCVVDHCWDQLMAEEGVISELFEFVNAKEQGSPRG